MTTTQTPTTELIVFLPVKPEAREEFRAKLAAIAGHIVQEPAFVSASVHEDLHDPDTLVLREAWACSGADLLDQLARPYRAEYEATLSSMLKADRRIVFLTPPLATYEASGSAPQE
ncbi:Quinol monooxygenase YgiN [Pseudonocardia thermophila]|jgi:Uncharacterized conserved protein|uniref:Quinol monooxygenase YgiN n=1 Tax=Pseudonocardia thermophila TaxID=1848 RepID=A0A1M6P5V8_PSETH|nr:antibiotic biosynthesis monooxygenase [Pseudonocardia thermophila]SHK03325.1 Quinol monooxygenase YgiN [Pseudonocardia thermophila]